MTGRPDHGPTNDSSVSALGEHLLVEDVMLLLFQPDSGSFAGENILFYVLAGIERKPHDVQTVLAAIGPNLRAPVLDRLVERGDIVRERGKRLGILPFTKLTPGGGRRARLIGQVRAVLTDGESPSVRTAARIALLSASGTLPQFDREIPWSGDVYTRAKAIERGEWGAAAASEAVARTMAAVLTNALTATLLMPRN